MDPIPSSLDGGEHAASSDLHPIAAETGNVVRNESTVRWSDDHPQRLPDQNADLGSNVASPPGPNGAVGRFTTMPSPHNSLIVDVEGFQLNKDFYVKELAFYQPSTREYWAATFKPPFGRQYVKKRFASDMDWVTRNLHGLKWEDGQFPYAMAFHMISHFGSTYQLYAKGEEKSLWVQQQTPFTVVNLELLGFPKAKELPFGCFCRHHNTLEKSCALDKAVRLGTYYNELFSLVHINVDNSDNPNSYLQRNRYQCD